MTNPTFHPKREKEKYIKENRNNVITLYDDLWALMSFMPLSIAFPTLYAITGLEDAWFGCLEDWWRRGGWCWNLVFAKPFSDWEPKVVNNIFLCLSHEKVQPSLEDRAIWLEEKRGKISAKSQFKILKHAPFFFFSKYHLATCGSA